MASLTDPAFILAVVVVLSVVGGLPLFAIITARSERKDAAQRQRFELEKARIELEREQMEADKPICLCEHGANMHSHTGLCEATLQRPVEWNGEGVAVGYERVGCECLNYTGPVPPVTGSILGELNQR